MSSTVALEPSDLAALDHILEFPNFTTVRLPAVPGLRIVREEGRSGFQGAPYVRITAHVDSHEHVITDRDAGNMGLLFDGKRIRGAHFRISPAWDVAVVEDNGEPHPLEQMRDAASQRAKD